MLVDNDSSFHFLDKLFFFLYLLVCFCFVFAALQVFFSRYFLFIFIFFDTLLLRHKSRKTSCWWIQKKQQYHIEIILRLFFLSFYLKVGRSEEVFSFFSNLQKYEPNQCPPTFYIRLKSWGANMKIPPEIFQPSLIISWWHCKNLSLSKSENTIGDNKKNSWFLRN